MNTDYLLYLACTHWHKPTLPQLQFWAHLWCTHQASLAAYP